MTDTEVIYPPERTATVTCPECGGSGERAEKAPLGQRWAIDHCLRCKGDGTLPRKHYSYCKRAACIGCLPTIAEIEAMPIIEVWGEMLARCIPQSPDTKTHDGAVAAIRECSGWYETAAYFCRRYALLAQAIEIRFGVTADDLLV